VFVPTGLVADYGEPVTRTLANVWPAAAFVSLLVIGTLAAWLVSPILAFFATWFFITLAPTSSIVPIATEVGAERRMYLPLIAVVALVVVGAVHAMNRLGDRVRPVVARGALVTVCLVLIVLTLVRNAEYATTLGIWQTVVDRWPSGRGHYNYGLALKEIGRRSEAIEEYNRALPDSPGAHYALGFELQADGRYDEAIAHYREFIRIKPLDIDVPRAYHQIGRALLAQGKREDALVAFRESVARNPADQGSLAGIGDTLLALDRLPEAVTAYQNYLRRFPRSPEAMMNLGLTLVKLDRDAEARDQFAEVTRLLPDNVAAHVNLAYTLANTGNYSDSIREFRRALELEKDPAARADIEAAIRELLGH
jgi:tetratricopeptide (TPR) repeat protein